jgi:hypothetical protein
MDFISGAKNIGASAFGSSGSSSGSSGSGSSSGSSGSGSGSGLFSNFFNLSIQKMVLLLAIIAFVISVGTVAILLWKSKSSQKWPPEIAKCPDRMVMVSNAAGTSCVDNYGLFSSSTPSIARSDNNCNNFNGNKTLKYTGSGFSGVENAFVPWEGVFDSAGSRATSLKC